MLFVQQIVIEYRKNVRYSNYTQIRNSVKFYPVKLSVNDISEDVLFNTVDFFQDTDGLQCRYVKNKQFCKDKLYAGKFNCSPFGRNIAVKYFSDNKYEVHFYGGFDKTVFTLMDNEYGRIKFNERRTYWDSGEWYYQLFVFNFICCKKDKFKEKIFFNKYPDYEYNGMKYLRYC